MLAASLFFAVIAWITVKY